MAGTFKGLTQAQINRRIKEGRGQGHGSEYKPFIYTWEVSSLGRSHRLLGRKAQRLHHLLSDLELAICLALDWSPHVLDIREQFPMRVEDTTRIAAEQGFRQAIFRGAPQVLTSDFLVDLKHSKHPVIAIQAKYSADLQRPETIERLELERRYWNEKNIPWFIVTEREINKAAFNNIQWLYPAQIEEDVSQDELEHFERMFIYEFERDPSRKITSIAQSIDISSELEPGQALYWLRQLLANHYFLFDIERSYRELTAADLEIFPNRELRSRNSATG